MLFICERREYLPLEWKPEVKAFRGTLGCPLGVTLKFRDDDADAEAFKGWVHAINAHIKDLVTLHKPCVHQGLKGDIKRAGVITSA